MPAVNNSFRKTLSCFATCLLFVSMFQCLACAKSESLQFENKIQNMSDTDLLYYYAGINARIKEVGHGMDREENAYTYNPKHNIYSTPFSVGAEGYELIQKRNMILKELKVRNIDPSQNPALTLDQAK